MYADVGGCSDAREARALLLFTAVFVHGSESSARKWHYRP